MMKFKVYEKVWIMRDNKPKEMMVYSVIEQMAFMKGGKTEYRYGLVNGACGAGVGNNKEIVYCEDSIYSSKSELLESL